jgi:hypothetical protein
VPIPGRSRLYPLTPLGVGTALIESLTSYVIRLATAHNVPIMSLIRQELTQYISIWQRYICARSWTINGVGPIAERWVKVLQELTKRDDLSCLTLLPWRGAISHATLKHKRAWCPYCFDQWEREGKIIYTPLSWALETVKFCGVHLVPLESTCTNCKQSSNIIEAYSVHGFCSKCEKWLGRPPKGKPMAEGAITGSKPFWIATEIGKMLSCASKIDSSSNAERLRSSFRTSVRQSRDCNITKLASIAGLPRNRLDNYFRDTTPKLEDLIDFCFSFRMSLSSFLEDNLNTCIICSYAVPRNTSSPATNVKLKQANAMAVLLELLPPSATITYDISPNNENLQKYSPVLYRVLMDINKSNIEKNKTNLLKQKQLYIISYLFSNSIPIPLHQLAIKMGCKKRYLEYHFPNLCRAVTAKRRNFLRKMKCIKLVATKKRVFQIYLDLKGEGKSASFQSIRLRLRKHLDTRTILRCLQEIRLKLE